MGTKNNYASCEWASWDHKFGITKSVPFKPEDKNLPSFEPATVFQIAPLGAEDALHSCSSTKFVVFNTLDNSVDG